MSRIGRLPVPVPSGVEVTLDGPVVTVKGPKGTLSHTVIEPITVVQEDGTLLVQRPDDERESRARHGLTRSLVNNMVIGVTDGFAKTLEIVGVGYRVQARGSDLEFALGLQPPGPGEGTSGRQVRGPEPDPVRGERDRQAAGRRDRCHHPQAAQARPVQGQGRALPR